MKTKTNAIRVFATELLKDMLFPAKCPVCGDALHFEGRMALHALEEGWPVPSASKTGVQGFYDDVKHKNASKRMRYGRYYGGCVCEECIDTLDFITEPYCGKCGKKLAEGRHGSRAARENAAAITAVTAVKAYADNGDDRRSTKLLGGQQTYDTDTFRGVAKAAADDELCDDCRAKQRSFTQCRCLMNYDEAARDIMTAVKYGGQREYLRLMALLAAERLGDWIDSLDIDCLVPVPVHADRLRKRGYNQSEVLCRYLGRLMGIPVRTDILCRSKRTAAQKELTADKRLLNLQNAFESRVKLEASPTVMICDDIYTTGSTMEACTEKLLEAGAARVYGMCICAGEDTAKPH